MCCRPHPSLMRFGTYFLRSPVRFGVWYMRISTLSGPNSSIKGASRDAEHVEGVSRVPRRASVRTLSFNSGFARRVSARMDIYSFRSTMHKRRAAFQGYQLIHVQSCLYTMSKEIYASPPSVFYPTQNRQHQSPPHSRVESKQTTHLQRLIKLARRPQHLHLVPPNIKPRRNLIQLLRKRRQHRGTLSSRTLRAAPRHTGRGCRVPPPLRSARPLPTHNPSRSCASQQTPRKHNL